jgi:hypothetical protein
MCKSLLILAFIAELIGPSTRAVAAEESRMVELSPPRALHADDSIELQVATGPLPRGSRLVVMTERGEILGVVTPFNVLGTGSGATATVPVPQTAMTDGRLRLRLQVVEQGAAPRAPRPEEFRLTPVVVPK